MAFTVPANADLLARAQAGDARALELLLAEHAPRIARFAAHMCRHAADADDVVQETLISASRALRSFRGQSALPTWLFAIARSHCRRQRRKARSGSGGAVDVHEPAAVRDLQLTDRAEPADQALQGRELAAEVAGAMAQLAPAYREVLLLRDVEGLTAPEVGVLLGTPVATVKTRLHRARMQVRDRLAPLLEASGSEPSGCPDIGRIYSRHLEGDIGPATCARMQQHLQDCPYCARRCATLRAAVASCAALKGDHIPVRLQSIIRHALDHAGAP
ncbi:MAG: sigma-70 family RNA polymerase sigma factor [Deltaproteobacteria bacterium]|nr:sigma-70 family RNA polymerase sigma factor [Deltaproteobacteria bacterium]